MSPIQKKRQECEVFTRTCGYYRPKAQMNDAMKAMHDERVYFKSDYKK